MRVILIASLAALLVGCATSAAVDIKGATSIVDEFQQRLRSGDTQAALQLLEQPLLVYEVGGVERSRDEYAAEHLGADAAFLKGATVRQLSRREGGSGEVAWVATETEVTTAGDNPKVYLSTETMVLTRTAQGWRISHIHWSSRARRNVPAGT